MCPAGHGTHVAGTIGALRNGLGVVGVAAQRARMYIFNIFGPYGSFPESVSSTHRACTMA
jgi:subtilisin family serine protease